MPIELKNVAFEYPDGTVANRDISLTIADGERLAIIGQNGAGKTTAVKLMNALNKPTSGTVLVDGIDTRERTTAQIARSVGYVFQNPDDQIFNKDVITELEYMPRYFKLPEYETKQRIDRAIELAGIGEYLKMSPYDTPYPIRKFVTIAAVLVTTPKFLILDEPTAGQDLRGLHILENLLEQLSRDGISVVTITHDMEFAAANFPRIVVMANARIISDGKAADIFWNKDILHESGIKKPQMSVLAQRLSLPGRLLFCDEVVAAVIGG